MHAGTLRVQLDRTSEAIDRLLVIPGMAEHNADGVERGRRCRQQRQGVPRRRHRFVGVMQPGEPPPELRMSLGIGRLGGAGLADERESFGDAASSAARTPRSSIDDARRPAASLPQRSKRYVTSRPMVRGRSMLWKYVRESIGVRSARSICRM